MKFRENGSTFRVTRFDDGRDTPYRIFFWNEALTGSSYRFDGNGDLVYFKAGSEVYYDVVKNDSDGTIEFSRKAERSSEREAHDDGPMHDFREEFSCDQCSEALSAVCGAGTGHEGGLYEFCDAVDVSALGSDGADSVEILCDNYGNACAKATALCGAVCDAGEWWCRLGRLCLLGIGWQAVRPFSLRFVRTSTDQLINCLFYFFCFVHLSASSTSLLFRDGAPGGIISPSRSERLPAFQHRNS